MFDWYKKEIENGSFRKAPKIPRRCRKKAHFWWFSRIICSRLIDLVYDSDASKQKIRESISAFFLSFSNGKVQELKNVYLTQVLVWGQKSLFFCCLDAIEKIEAGGPKRNPKSCRLRVLAMFFYVGTLGASNSGGQWFRSHFFSSQKKFGRFLLAMLLLLMLLEKQLALHYKKVLKISETRVIWIMKILRWLISKTNCNDFLGDFLTILTLKYGKKFPFQTLQIKQELPLLWPR